MAINLDPDEDHDQVDWFSMRKEGWFPPCNVLENCMDPVEQEDTLENFMDPDPDEDHDQVDWFSMRKENWFPPCNVLENCMDPDEQEDTLENFMVPAEQEDTFTSWIGRKFLENCMYLDPDDAHDQVDWFSPCNALENCVDPDEQEDTLENFMGPEELKDTFTSWIGRKFL